MPFGVVSAPPAVGVAAPVEAAELAVAAFSNFSICGLRELPRKRGRERERRVRRQLLCHHLYSGVQNHYMTASFNQFQFY